MAGGGYRALQKVGAKRTKRLEWPGLLLAGLLAVAPLPAAGPPEPLGSQTPVDLGPNPSIEQVQAAESRLVKGLARAPDDALAARSLRRFYRRWSSSLPAPDPELLTLLRRSADPERLALRLTDDRMAEPAAQGILLAALAERPASTGLWLRAARLSISTSLAIACEEEALRTFLAAHRPLAPADLADAAAIAAQALSRTLAAGLTVPAAAAFAALPPAVRERIAASPLPEVTAAEEGLARSGEVDPRLDLAAAALLNGDPDGARRLLLADPPSPSSSIPDDHEIREILRRSLDRAPDDPFLALVDILGGRHGPGLTLAQRLLAAHLAEVEGYPAIAGVLWDQLAGGFFDPYPRDGAPPAVARRVEEIHQAIESLHERALQAAAADRAEALGPDRMGPRVERRLARPSSVVFVERPLPAGLTLPAPVPAAAPGRHLPGRSVTALHGRRSVHFRPPALPDFAPVVIEQKGERLAILGTSTSLDPAGAYWLALSEDGGATWKQLLYTGLRPGEPYTAVGSDLPLLEGDRLRFAVRLAHLKPRAVTFPTVRLAAQRKRAGMVLEVALADLARDGDGDGLTDLEEDRLLTDPDDPDTDGDGLGDAEVPLPLVARGPVDAPAEVLAALSRVITQGLERLEPGGRAALDPAAATPTLYVCAPRALFAGIAAGRRLVVLGPDECDAAAAKMGPHQIFDLRLLALDRVGRRAYVEWTWWSAGGGTYGGVLFERESGGWTVRRKDVVIACGVTVVNDDEAEAPR